MGRGVRGTAAKARRSGSKALLRASPIRQSAIAPLNSGEDRLQTIVIGLRNRIEFVVVAAGAMGGKAQEGGHGVCHHVVSVDQARLLLINCSFAQLDLAYEIPRAGDDEPGRNDARGRARLKDIPGYLLFDELPVGLIFVERTDHVIAVRPGVVTAFILVVTVGIAVVD